MNYRNSRKEPGFSKPGNHSESEDDLFASRFPPEERLDPRLRLAAYAVLVVCALIVIEWGIQKYQQYRANQALKELVAGFEQSMETSAAEMRAMTERNRREAERKRLALRQQRASTSEGKWLAKNCSDWRRAYSQMQAETAEREMRKHCRIYERYLETGIANTSVR